MRDLLRQRARLVRQCTANLLSLRTLIERNTGGTLKSATLKTRSPEELAQLVAQEEVGLAVAATTRVRHASRPRSPGWSGRCCNG